MFRDGRPLSLLTVYAATSLMLVAAHLVLPAAHARDLALLVVSLGTLAAVLYGTCRRGDVRSQATPEGGAPRADHQVTSPTMVLKALCILSVIFVGVGMVGIAIRRRRGL